MFGSQGVRAVNEQDSLEQDTGVLVHNPILRVCEGQGGAQFFTQSRFGVTPGRGLILGLSRPQALEAAF